MGITESLTGAVLIPLNAQISERGLAVVAAAGFVSFITLAVVLNVLSQLLFKNPNEPPLVFHWFPIIGNTISYGMDPYPFFFKCREKVREHDSWAKGHTDFSSMAISSPLFSSERRPPYTLEQLATSSSSMANSRM